MRQSHIIKLENKLGANPAIDNRRFSSDLSDHLSQVQPVVFFFHWMILRAMLCSRSEFGESKKEIIRNCTVLLLIKVTGVRQISSILQDCNSTCVDRDPLFLSHRQQVVSLVLKSAKQVINKVILLTSQEDHFMWYTFCCGQKQQNFENIKIHSSWI